MSGNWRPAPDPEGALQARPGARTLNILAAVPVVIAVMLAGYWLVWTFLAWYRLHPHLPWRDSFVILNQLLPYFDHGLDWSIVPVLLEPHYAAHRIALSRILVGLDCLWFGGHNHLLYAAAWLAMAAILALYLLPARHYFGRHRGGWWITGTLAVILLFQPAHLWNLVDPIAGSWHLTFAFSLAAFALALPGSGRAGPGRWLAAYACATLAAFATFGGVVCWLLLPLVAIRQGWRYFLPALVCSAGCAALYLHGITSDAAVALNWQTGAPAALEQVRRAAGEALAANTPLRIAGKVLVFLSWPLSSQWPMAGQVLGAGSLVLLAWGWATVSLRWWRGGEPWHPWLERCLLLATLGAGIAVATQLGRVIEQPNYAHGPSYERFQTVVACYWLGVFGLLAGLWPVTRSRVLPARLAMLVLAVGLTMPWGAYLEQEVASAETAARLFTEGERGLQGTVAGDRSLRYKPEFVFRFDALFRARQLAYHAPVRPPLAAHTVDCTAAGLRFEFAPAAYPGVSTAIAGAGFDRQWATRDLILFSGEYAVGRLNPVLQGDYTPRALLDPGNTRWQGLVSAGAAGGALRVVAVTPRGERVLCAVAPQPR